MSWAITLDDSKDETMELKEVLAQAKAAKIIMVASANDEGAHIHSERDSYPAAAKDSVICIGEASASGFATEAAAPQADFIFPGVFLSDDSASGTQQVITGSSVATAYAAGFIALIMYCVEFATLQEQHNGATNIREIHRKKLQEKVVIERIFDHIKHWALDKRPATASRKCLFPCSSKMFPEKLTTWNSERRDVFLRSLEMLVQYVTPPLFFFSLFFFFLYRYLFNGYGHGTCTKHHPPLPRKIKTY